MFVDATQCKRALEQITRVICLFLPVMGVVVLLIPPRPIGREGDEEDDGELDGIDDDDEEAEDEEEGAKEESAGSGAALRSFGVFVRFSNSEEETTEEGEARMLRSCVRHALHLSETIVNL